MTLNELLPHLSGVRQTSRGVLAICPSHNDKNPSLSAREGDRGLLLRCWAGCSTEEIVSALGLHFSDLFYAAGLPRQARQRRPARPRLNLRHIAFSLQLHSHCLFLRSASVLDKAQNTDISEWTDTQLDRAIGAVVRAYHDLGRADLLDEVALNLRCRILGEEQSRAA